VTPPIECKSPKGASVIGNWFLFNSTHTLNLIGKDFFIDIECYASHFESPNLVDDGLCLTEKSFDYIKALIGQAYDPLRI
jgi:hypothetical protein